MMDWEKANALVQNAQRIIILTHISPDGDAIGSMLGLGHALRDAGKTVSFAVDGGVPPGLRFMPGSAEVAPKLESIDADLIIVTDCGDERRVGKVGEVAFASGKPIINLDHHRTNPLFGHANLVDVSTVASAEGVLDWLDKLHISLNPEAAQCLLCGLVTDTLCFRTNSTTGITLGKAQRLMDSGASLSFIVQNTVSRMPTSAIRLWGQVMPTVRIEDRVIWAKITRAARQEAEYHDGTDGGLVSILLQADEAYISCVLREKEDGNIEIGFRAVPGFDVSKVAVSVGGGGHTLASGATVPGPLDEAEARIIPLLKDAAKEGTPVVP